MVLQFPWVAYITPGLVEALKLHIPAHAREYDPVTKIWSVGFLYADQAIAILRRAFPETVIVNGYGQERHEPPPRVRQPLATERHFAALHLLPSAPPELVNTAYRTLAKLHHPDVLPAGERERATRTVQELNVAIEALRSAGVA